MNNLVNSDDLRSWTKIEQKSKLEQWLDEEKIKYWSDKQGWPITTLDEIQGNSESTESDDQWAFRGR